MKQLKRGWPSLRRVTSAFLAVLAVLISTSPMLVSAAANPTGVEAQAFASAASEFGVPKQVLLAVSYHQSRWESYQGQMSADGGFGPMDLRTKFVAEDGRGDPARPVPTTPTATGDLTLDMAAQLLHVSTDTLKSDATQNIRGGAAVLAQYAKQTNNGTLPTNVGDWYAAVAKMSGASDATQAASFADDVYTTLKSGVSATTTGGQKLSVLANSSLATPDHSKLTILGLRNAPATNNGAECPAQLNCRFVPAGYAQNSSDPTDYGNYDHANRPQDMQIKYIVIHDTEGSYQSAISHFQDTTSYVSANYVIRSSDGAITQMVANHDVAWHAGDWWMNMHSIGIEHEGVAAAGASWYTEAMYRSSAQLVRFLAAKYHIPLDRAHIIGHDNVPGLSDAHVAANHWDPGPYWDWNHYMDLVQGVPAGTNARANGDLGLGASQVVTISPNFSQNMQTVIPCTGDNVCSGSQTQASNFVWLRTAASPTAPLITDPLLHPGGEPGTINMNDWTAKATTGQQFALAGRQGDWTAIWFGNQRAWFYNPDKAPTAHISRGTTVTLKPGLASTNIYGGAYPETSVYPANVNYPQQPQLSYKIAAGQHYVSYGVVPTDYFYDWTIDSSAPHDHEVFQGKDQFVQIWYNHRMMFVRASDVVSD
jgi:N-acetyl-anhydromuramyl-L-alanine amidase AmpD